MDKFGRQDAKASKNIWHRIHRNIFTHREPKSVTEDDVLICACVPDPETGKGCGPDCINRDVLVECDPALGAGARAALLALAAILLGSIVAAYTHLVTKYRSYPYQLSLVSIGCLLSNSLRSIHPNIP